jgi:hypothetical protein
MKAAEQIAEIAQSDHIWELFVRSKLFVHAAPNAAVLDEACAILRSRLNRMAENHQERARKEKALQRIAQRGLLLATKTVDTGNPATGDGFFLAW